jgi:hypothetical protein
MTGKRTGDVNQRENIPGRLAACSGQSPDHKWVERVGPVKVHHRLSGQRTIRSRMQPESQHQWMAMQHHQAVIGVKRDLRMTQCQEPFTGCIGSFPTRQRIIQSIGKQQ